MFKNTNIRTPSVFDWYKKCTSNKRSDNTERESDNNFHRLLWNCTLPCAYWNASDGKHQRLASAIYYDCEQTARATALVRFDKQQKKREAERRDRENGFSVIFIYIFTCHIVSVFFAWFFFSLGVVVCRFTIVLSISQNYTVLLRRVCINWFRVVFTKIIFESNAST